MLVIRRKATEGVSVYCRESGNLIVNVKLLKVDNKSATIGLDAEPRFVILRDEIDRRDSAWQPSPQ